MGWTSDGGGSFRCLTILVAALLGGCCRLGAGIVVATTLHQEYPSGIPIAVRIQNKSNKTLDLPPLGTCALQVERWENGRWVWQREEQLAENPNCLQNDAAMRMGRCSKYEYWARIPAGVPPGRYRIAYYTTGRDHLNHPDHGDPEDAAWATNSFTVRGDAQD